MCGNMAESTQAKFGVHPCLNLFSNFRFENQKEKRQKEIVDTEHPSLTFVPSWN